MIRTIFQLGIAAAVLVGAYKALSTYALFQLADHMRACLPVSGACRLVERRAARQPIEAVLNQAYACARQRQTMVESVVLRIPELAPSSSSEPLDYAGLGDMCEGWGQAGPGPSR